MPRDTDLSDSDSLTMRQKLEGMASNFERRERQFGRGSALRALKNELDILWRIARDEELDMIGVKDV